MTCRNCLQPGHCSTSVDLVSEFHEACLDVDPPFPFVPSEVIRSLRLRLMLEELGELAEALGFRYVKTFLEMIQENLSPDSEPMALDHILKELCDCRYVQDGTVLALGFREVFGAAFEEVHRSNMTKFPDGPPRKPGEKLVKGPHYEPAEMAQFIKGEN